MSPKLPVVSGRDLLKFLVRLGYAVERQRGSHARLKIKGSGYALTVPMHREVARGTLNDILAAAARHCGLPKDELVERLAASV